MVPVKLNFAAIETNLNHNEELIQAIVVIIVEDLPILVEELQLAKTKKDDASIRRTAHKINGLISQFKAEPLTSLTNELQSKRPIQYDANLDALFELVGDACRRTIEELKAVYGFDGLGNEVKDDVK